MHDYGSIDGRLFIDMQYFAGTDLAALISNGPLSPDRAVDVVAVIELTPWKRTRDGRSPKAAGHGDTPAVLT